MLRWLYLTLFARRAVWVLEKSCQGERARLRLTVYEPTAQDISARNKMISPLLAHGWKLVSGPKPQE